MNMFWKGALAGALAVLSLGATLAVAGSPQNGRYVGLEREGPVVIVDTQTGDSIIQGASGRFEGHHWAAAWKSE